MERQQVRAVTLPLVQNVPRYTSYMYAAYENSHVQDEVRRRLLFPDHEAGPGHPAATPLAATPLAVTPLALPSPLFSFRGPFLYTRTLVTMRGPYVPRTLSLLSLQPPHLFERRTRIHGKIYLTVVCTRGRDIRRDPTSEPYTPPPYTLSPIP